MSLENMIQSCGRWFKGLERTLNYGPGVNPLADWSVSGIFKMGNLDSVSQRVVYFDGKTPEEAVRRLLEALVVSKQIMLPGGEKRES